MGKKQDVSRGSLTDGVDRSRKQSTIRGAASRIDSTSTDLVINNIGAYGIR